MGVWQLGSEVMQHRSPGPLYVYMAWNDITERQNIYVATISGHLGLHTGGIGFTLIFNLEEQLNPHQWISSWQQSGLPESGFK